MNTAACSKKLCNHIWLIAMLLPGCALSPEWRRREKVAVPVSSQSQAESAPPNSTPVAPRLSTTGRLGLQECVDYAIERNFSVRQSLALARASQAVVEVQKAEFDPQFYGNVRTDRDPDSGWSGVNGSAGVMKKFTAGTEIELEGGEVATRTGDFRDDYIDGTTSNFAGTLRQPLLRGGGRRANLAGIKLSELLRDQASATVTAEILETLRAAETAYYAAAVAGMVEKSQRESLGRAQKLLADVKVRHKAGGASRIDILEAETAFSSAQERVVTAHKTAKDRIGDLWLVVGAPLGDKLPEVTFAGLSEKALPSEDPKGSQSFARAMSTAPSAILLVNEVQRKEVELLRARNRALPRLDAELSAASADDSAGSSDWEGVALVRVNVPWAMRAEKAQLAVAKAELERSTAAQEQATERLKQRIYELCRGIDAGRAQLSAAIQTASASRQKWDEQMLRQKDGLVTVRDLRESEEELQAAEVREQQARLGLFAGWSALTQLDGTIVQRHGLSL